MIWNPDIFGFNSGITRQLADRLNEEIGVSVLVVDYFRGDYVSPRDPTFRRHLAQQSDWEGRLLPDWQERVKPYAEGHGCKVYGAHGTIH